MNKTLTVLIIAVTAVLSLSTLSYADNASNSATLRIREQNEIQTRDTDQNQIQERDKEQFRTRLNNNSTDNEFMIKGNITSSTSNTITVNGKLISLDSSVTGNVKIVGNIQTGAYVMVQGIIKNSNYYANKVIIDQRNKEQLREGQELNMSSTDSAKITPTPNSSNSAFLGINQKGGINMKNLLISLENILIYLRKSFLNL